MRWQLRTALALAVVSVFAGLGHAVPNAASPPAAAAVHAQLLATPSLFQLRLPEAPVREDPPAPRAPARRSGPVDCAKMRCVALTMDDGPVGATRGVLALLRRKQVPATFFVVGTQARAHPGLIRRMVADGHVVGNHSWNHPEFWGMSRGAVRRQLSRTDAVLKRITGKRPVLVRPPFGELNRKVRSVARARHQALVLWDVDPLDWKDRSATTVARRVLQQTRRGSIILTHDVWPSTRHAYARIIDGLRARGFTFVTVPQLLGPRTKPGRVYLRR